MCLICALILTWYLYLEGDEDVNMQTEEVESSAKKEMSDLEVSLS